MGYSYTLSLFMFIAFVLSPSLFFHVSVSSTSSSRRPPLCHDDERSSLLQFKESFFIIDDEACVLDDPLAYPKLQSWKVDRGEEASTDCCSWDGVECDVITGHVIAIDLSSSCLLGSINSSSSLFHLVHLSKLNLAFNHFNYSQIPSSFGYLSKLTSLNLSTSFFSGQIPSNISDLSMLSSLDLSMNDQLMLENPDFTSLVQNLTSIKVLNLNSVDISSKVPLILANSSSLASLRLKDCGLYGKFPPRILQLPKLDYLSLSKNPNLEGHLPEFHFNSPLRILSIVHTSFSGEIPASIGNLNSLTYLALRFWKFTRRFPSSLGNLTNLELINLSANSFDAQNMSSLLWFGKMTKLTYLDLNLANLYGEIPYFLANLTQLSGLFLGRNQLTGSIPLWLLNLTQLTTLELSGNRLQGVIPRSISQFENLEMLDLNSNQFSGTVELDMFLNLSKLHFLDLSSNNISLLVNSSSNATFQKFSRIRFGSCKLSAFPDFLRHQDKLQSLDLSRNNIGGQVPKWFFNVSTDTLMYLSLHDNFLTSFEGDQIVLPWDKLHGIALGNNMLRGSLPLPPPSIELYSVGGNNFSGEISSVFCNLTSLSIFTADGNNLSGKLPSCFSNSSTSIRTLDFGRSNFVNIFPRTLKTACKLKMIAINHNHLQGNLPRSLLNCTGLEFIDVGNNQFNDVFPSWLGVLPNLKVLLLRANHFHGLLPSHKTKFEFQNLHIFDLSRNNFSGQLPTNFFLNRIAMEMVEVNQSMYMGVAGTISEEGQVSYQYESFLYSMSITNKGNELEYNQILDFFIAMDLSCNRFEGEIPPAIGNLKGLHMLNLSNNILSGQIPSSLGNLTALESLDLSQNNLSGEIPLQLEQLNLLAVFNVSYNNVSGPVPQGKQFDTFLNNSYKGNPGLCGKILSKK